MFIIIIIISVSQPPMHLAVKTQLVFVVIVSRQADGRKKTMLNITRAVKKTLLDSSKVTFSFFN